MAAKTPLRELGAFIKELREREGLSQEDLAKRVGSTQSVIARIETGEQNTTAETLAKLSKALARDVVRLGDNSLNIRVEGGRKLHGTVTTQTSKNGTMGVFCAALLNAGKTHIRNVPNIEEVKRVIEVFESIGIKVERKGNDVLITPPSRFDLSTVNAEASNKIRSIIMLIGPLLHFFGGSHFTIPAAGGCKLGARTVNPHFFALEKLGVTVDVKDGLYKVKVPRVLKASEVVLYEAGDTVTENALMAAALIPGTTTLKFASANYQVQEVCFFLEKLGVKIEGIGTSTLIIHGIKRPKAEVEYAIAEDPIDSMFFIAASIVTHSPIAIKRAPIEFLELELEKLRRMGFKYSLSKKYFAQNGRTALVDIVTKPGKLMALPDKIHAQPYPGINMDNLPFFAVIATVAEGTTFIHDWVYEKRAIYYTELDKLGAQTLLADPHRIYITGPTKLKAAEVMCPSALRPATIILIAMLAAEGRSVLRNLYSIIRGYENLIERLNTLGAKIEVLREF